MNPPIPSESRVERDSCPRAIKAAGKSARSTRIAPVNAKARNKSGP